MKKLQYIHLVLMIILLWSCTQQEPNVPKPLAYPRVDRTDSLLCHTVGDFVFRYSSDARLKQIAADKKNQVWFNMEYPHFNAVLYCSYTKISRGDLDDFLADNQKIISTNAPSNTRVEESRYVSLQGDTQGSLYYFDGNAIAPYQFYLTDSVSYFLRGSLYYNQHVQTDSIRPTTLSLKKDIVNLMEGFEHRSKK